MASEVGLMMFVSVCILNVIGLQIDVVHWLLGMPTVSQEVRKQPLLGLPILSLQLIGFAGLALHFYG